MTINITLPDGSLKQFDGPLSVLALAKSIAPSLAKAAIAGKVNDCLVDVDYLIETDAKAAIITDKDQEGLEVIRHSSAHLLAQAVKHLYPSAQVTIGPVIEDGFYYDFAFERAFTLEDLEGIEREMTKIVKQALPVERIEMSREEAIAFFEDLGEQYKVEIIASIPEGDVLSFYRQGDFMDLCRGPHVPNTDKLKVFKLTKVAGAYWRGDAKNEMLSRIYGTAWSKPQELKDYLHRLEEAEKRDHRKLAKKLNLFHQQEEAPGMVFWHDKGWTIYSQIKAYISQLLVEGGYQQVDTPQIVDRKLWEQSGHWEKFAEEMFITETENHTYAIKPMNCPCHVQIFKQGLKSYRDLPIRMAEFGSCHRSEPSGSLHGLMRLRHFVQDDAHIFCTHEQIQSEVSRCMDLVFKVYSHFGFEDIIIKLSTRPDNRVGSDSIWDQAEASLEQSLNTLDRPWSLFPGEGAFYGPKIEFSLKDCLGRVWQCGTIQLDFSTPERLGAYYIDEAGQKQVPVMVHRAILGSIERFIGILIEHYAGDMPFWLSPIQAVVINITDSQKNYAEGVYLKLKEMGIRTEVDLRNEKIGFKIREHALLRVPFQLIVGDREKSDRLVSVRARGGKDLGQMTIDSFMRHIEAIGTANSNKAITDMAGGM